MKKRLLSVFLALTMIMSFIPHTIVLAAEGPSSLGKSGKAATTFATFTESNNSDAYSTTAAATTACMKNVSITFANGVATSATFDPNYGGNNTAQAAYSIFVFTNLSYMEDATTEADEVGGYSNFLANQNGPSGTLPFAWGKVSGKKRTDTGTTLTFTKGNDFTSEYWAGNDGEEDYVPYTTFYDSDLTEYTKTDFTTGEKKLPIQIAMNCGSQNQIMLYNTTIPLDYTGTLSIPVPEPTGSEITGANLGDITANGLTAAPTATVSSTDSNAALNTDLTVTYTWDPTTGGGSGATFPTTPGVYTLTATAALASGTTYTLADSFALSGTGWTPDTTDNKVATAQVTIPGTITAADLTNISPTAKVGDDVPAVAVTSATPVSTVSLDSITWTDSKTDSDTFTAEKTYTATATLKAATPAVYSFATTGALAVNSTTTNGWKITSNDGTTVTMTKDVTVTTNNVTAADVVVTGTAPSDGTQVSAATFNVSTTTSGAELENNVVWKDPDNNTMSSTDTFEPGKKYTATITVTPKTGTNTVLGGDPTTSVDTTGVTGFDTSGVNVTSNTTTSVVVTAEVTIPKRTITTIGATIAEPSAGQNPPTDVTSMSVGDSTHTENLADGTVASFAPQTAASKAAAGSGNWTATFTVTAPEGYKFNETANAYSSSNTTVTDWTVTDVTVASGGGSATVTVTHAQDPKKITAMSIAATTAVTKDADNTDTVTATDIGDLTVNITYNDGTTGDRKSVV